MLDLVKYITGAVLAAFTFGLAVYYGDISESSKCDGQRSLRVMSYNIRYDNPTDGINRWSNRKMQVAETIRFYSPDIFGIQEGLPHQVNYLAKQLPGYSHVGVGRDGKDEGGEKSSVFYKSLRFELLDHQTFWLTPEEDTGKPSIGWDAALPRIVTWIKVLDQNSDEIYFFFNTHFDHEGVDARTGSARLIVSEIQRITGGYPVILVGDFNVTPDSRPYRIITDSPLDDAKMISKYPNYGPDATFPNESEPFYLPREKESGRRIDYIFTGRGFEVIHFATISNYRDGRFPSDHLPILAELRIK